MEKYFSHNIVYKDWSGTRHNGKENVKKCFIDKNINGNIVQKLSINRIISEKNAMAVEWYFKGMVNILKNCVEQNEIKYSGVLILDFDENNEVMSIKEFWGMY